MSAPDGPVRRRRARAAARRNRMLAVVIALVLLARSAWVTYVRFDAKDQWAAGKWKPFLRPEVWTTFILPGLVGTLAAASPGVVLAGRSGSSSATARLSDHRWIRWPAAAVVEFFRADPAAAADLLRLLRVLRFSYRGQRLGLHRRGVRPDLLQRVGARRDRPGRGAEPAPGPGGGGLRDRAAQGPGHAAGAAAAGVPGHDAGRDQPVRGAAEGLGARADRGIRQAASKGSILQNL